MAAAGGAGGLGGDGDGEWRAGRARRRRLGATGKAGNRIAVLPFENQGASADEYFADGIADEVRGKLSRVSGLKVIASSSASQYKGTTKTPAGDRRANSAPTTC